MIAKDDSVRPYPMITEAIRRGSWSNTAALLQQYPEMRELDVPAFGTWLHYACAHGTLEIAQGLAADGFDIRSTRERNGISPLAMAATKGRAEIVSWLLQCGVALDTSTALRNSLFGSVLARSAPIASALLAAGIDTAPRYRLGSSKETVDAVAFAMLHGTRDIATLIAQKNCACDESCVENAMAEGLRIAETITA